MKSCAATTTATSNPFLSFLLRTWNSGSCDYSLDTSRFLRDYAVWEINAFLWISLITITCLLTNKLFKLFKLWTQARKIPGPPCPSFYGHFNTVSKQSLTELLSDSHGEYGSVVKLWLGPTQLLVSIKEPELIKEMLLKAKDKLPLTGKAFRLAFGRSTLFASSFDEVEKRRELLASELNGRLIERANVIPTKAVDCIMEKLHHIMGKGSIDCKMVSQHMAFTLLGAMLFGDTFLAWSKATIYEELLTRIAKDACFWASYSVTPFWEQGFWRYQRLCTKLKCLTQDLVQQCSKNYKLYHGMDPVSHNETANAGMEATVGSKSYSGIFLQDFFSLEELNCHPKAREEPCGDIMGMMFHGCLTTAGLISNMLVRLVTHPEIQHKIYSEIIMAQKGSGEIDQPNAEKMPLLLATVYESARLMPAGPLLQRCSLKHDLRLKSGVIIPTGAILVVPVQLVQMDDSSWGNDAAKFNPYRFLSTTAKISGSLNKDISIAGPVELLDQGQSSFVLNDPNKNPAFLPFGSGTRACVCQKFVIQGIARLFASLLEQYEVRLQPGSKTNSKPMTNDSIFQNFPSPEIAFSIRNN
ncbi:11-oxo-beta-amyrin 30-oxidase-like [Herrania umbratica]|uniref:11-oxo-beta-amyrin 30-oxidase-like n=1 Tax=Herrania umbratica TaxID=108875 RepID=A0A6J1BB76_9ROSI|nr:11-oxo-beta-amyrin 30-oxidase-like [Herrania umbratica]